MKSKVIIETIPLTPDEVAERETWLAEIPAKEHALVEDARRQEYRDKADPLFFGFQAGENTEQDWLDARQAVKDAHPYPTKEAK